MCQCENVDDSRMENRTQCQCVASILFEKKGQDLPRVFVGTCWYTMVNYCMPLGRETWYLEVHSTLSRGAEKRCSYLHKCWEICLSLPRCKTECKDISFSLGSEVQSLVPSSSNRARMMPAPKTQETALRASSGPVALQFHRNGHQTFSDAEKVRKTPDGK